MIKRLALMLAMVLGLVVVANSASHAVAAEEGKGEKGGGRRGQMALPTADAIEEKLGEKLTDEQKKKVTEIHDAIAKKDAELEAKDEVKKIREEAKSAEGPARREIYAKLKEAKGGYEAFAEYKKELASVLSEAQIAKAFPKRERGEGKGGAQGEGKKKEGGDKKEGGEKPEAPPAEQK